MGEVKKRSVSFTKQLCRSLHFLKNKTLRIITKKNYDTWQIIGPLHKHQHSFGIRGCVWDELHCVRVKSKCQTYTNISDLVATNHCLVITLNIHSTKAILANNSTI